MLADRFDGFLIDLDGVIYIGDRLVPGASETVHRLREESIPFRFLTNTSSARRDELVDKLRRMGIDVQRDEIVSAAWATGRFLLERDFNAVAVVGNESLESELLNAGIQITDEDPEAVVVGHDSSLTYWDLTRGIRLLHNCDRPLIGVNGDPTVPREEGVVPGVGTILAALERGGDTRATIVGKPERLLFELATEMLPVSDVAMIGDMPGIDVRGANRAGLGSILVAGEGSERNGEHKPDFRIASIAEIFD